MITLQEYLQEQQPEVIAEFMRLKQKGYIRAMVEKVKELVRNGKQT